MHLPAYHENDCLISYRKPDQVPIIQGDKTHLYNVVNNLIDNALKYSGGNKPVEISLLENPGWLELSVRDQGCGIRPEHRQLIFDKFYRVSDDPSVKGFGLGLSYLKEVIKKHKGWYRVESEYGKGSRFIIGLPVADGN